VRGRVLYTVPRGFSGKGGIERHSGYLAAALREPGWNGLEGIRVDFMATRGPGHIALSPLYLVAALLRILGARLDALLGGGPLLVHLTVSLRGSTLRKGILAAWAHLLGAKVVLHLRGSGYDRFYRERPAPGRALIRRLFRRAARVLVLGEPWRRFMVEDLGVAADRVTVLPNAVPDPWAVPDPGPRAPTAPGEGPCRILFLGQLGARKGVPELIAALAALPPDSPPWQAVLAGDGDAAGFARKAAEAGLGERIAFPGWVDAEPAARLLAQADIYVLPSHAENLPVSVLEASSHGLAIVTTPVGAVPDHFHDGANARIVPAGDVPALAAALGLLLADPAERARLGAAARATYLERFSILAYRDRLAAIYRELLAGRGA